MDEVTSLIGPIETVNGQLLLRIPLGAGGDKLAPFAKGIGKIEMDLLVIEVPPWLAQKLNISEGSIVRVDNADRKFNIYRQSDE